MYLAIGDKPFCTHPGAYLGILEWQLGCIIFLKEHAP